MFVCLLLNYFFPDPSGKYRAYVLLALPNPQCFLPNSLVHFIKAALPCMAYLGDASGEPFLFKNY